MNKQNKDIRLTIRLTPEQHESICARAKTAQMTPSAYVRAVAMRHKVVVVDGLKEIAHELKGIGRNLNQLTVLANMGNITEVNLTETSAAMNKIYLALEEIAGQERH